MSHYWDQSKFDAALKEQLALLKGPKIPRALNKKGFFIALRASSETPKKEPFAISLAVSQVVTATRKDGTSGPVPLLFVLAAIRVGKKWAESKMVLGEKNRRRVNVQRAYLRALTKKADTILGSRKRSAGFLRVGWLNVVKEMAKVVGYQRGNAPAADTAVKQVGAMKGEARPATPDRQICTITNHAQSAHDHRNGLMRYGSPALERAFAAETADINQFLIDEAVREMADRFNAMQG